jgi:glucose/arabinose dehydrogenase/type 1 glutamine amidotransferase
MNHEGTRDDGRERYRGGTGPGQDRSNGNGAAGRRRFLKIVGSIATTGLAGCLGGDSGGSPTEVAPTTSAGASPGGGNSPSETSSTTTTGTPDETSTPTPREVALLVVSSTPDYRHESVPAGNEAIQELGDRIAAETGVADVTVDIIDSKGEHAETEPTAFPTEASELAEYDAIVFNNANGGTPPDEGPDVLDDTQQTAFEAYVRAGGGVVGIHSAIDAQRADSFYAEVMGSYFDSHPDVQEGTLAVTDRVHPSTSHLPAEWRLEAEWYRFTEDPRGNAHVLMTADTTSLDVGTDNPTEAGHHRPMAWCREVAGGRSWYTALGHLPEQFEDEAFREHLLGGIRWAAGLAAGDATGTVWDAYEKTPVTTDTDSPSIVDVAADGRVFYVDRGDYRNDDTEAIMAVDPGAETATTVLELEVYGTNNGIKGMVLEPGFEGEGWLYLNYAPPDAAIEEPYNRVSRFSVADGSVNPDSETEILRLPIQREIVGHRAGDLTWGPDGDQLYVAVGDDTYCCATDYAPIDEREGRTLYDAQRTSANTADLRGSILRIEPNGDGTYDVPEDNLFTAANGYEDEIEKGLVHPEIYVMGVRNPYRMAVDAATGALHWGDYGPDASAWDVDRGPPGVVEFDRATEAGFHGWPYVVGDGVPYRHYDFETEESGRIFDPDGPTNDSVHNDGLTDLPATTGAMITVPRQWEPFLAYPDEWEEYVSYDGIGDVPFPQVSGASPIGGPVYRRGEDHGTDALPQYYDGKVFIMERRHNWIKYVTLDEEGNPIEVDPFLPDTSFKRPMDLTVGPDGALYLTEWGSGWDAPNDDSGIYRIARTR